MEHRLKNLEDLCELITKEVVDQNKNMIDMNKNLIGEIRALREAYVKQDEDFEEFKNLLRKIYDLSRQNFPPTMLTQSMQAIGHPLQIPENIPGQINNSMLDHINQSMLNNLSFQSVQTPQHQNQVQNLQNLNQTMPLSASAITKQIPTDFSHLPPQVKPFSVAPLTTCPQQSSAFSGQQVKQFQNLITNQPSRQVPANSVKFIQSIGTTSTPHSNQFSFKPAPMSTIPSQIEKPKPPVFDFTPNKPGESKPILIPTPSTSETTSNIFSGLNFFMTADTNKQNLLTNMSTAANTFKPAIIISKNNSENFINKQNEDIEEVQASENPEEYEPQIEFKPVVNLKEVEVKTGEEDEEILLKLRCKLFRFDSLSKEWKEKGLGDLKLLKNKQTEIIRILMRREQVLKLCANHRLNKEMKLNEISPKQFSWIACDFSEIEPKNEILLAKFKTIDDANKFKIEFEKAVKSMKALNISKSPAKTQFLSQQVLSEKPSLAESLKTDFWHCNTCYAPNKKGDLYCACCSALNTKISTGESDRLSSQSQTQTQKIEFCFNSTKNQNSSLMNAINSVFSTNFTAQKIPCDKTSQPSFRSLKTITDSQIFSKDETNLSETSLFKPLGFSGGFVTPNNQSLFGSKPVPLFGSQTVKAEEAEEDAENQNPEEYEPEVEFKPLVKLQEVEVRTGEEDEEPIFKQRCKLYRYDSNLKEWKEKGTGEIKLLKHKKNENMFRILMRRDQVLKLCVNHRITNDLKWELFNEKQVRWYAQDYSEGIAKHELLSARFKNQEDAKKFKYLCEESQQITLIESSEKNSESLIGQTSIKQDGSKKMLSAIFNQTGWKCSDCYVLNKEEMSKCLACQKMREDTFSKVEQKETSDEKNEKNKFLFGQAKDTIISPISFSQTFGQASNSQEKLTETEKLNCIFSTKSGPSFSDLAKTTNTFKGGFTGGFVTPNNQSLFGSKPVPLFGSQTVKAEEAEEDAENQNPEEYEPEVEFKPLVKLQEVEVKTGEEDEDILFKQRCKLFRFDAKTKEWKEKGVGEIKILRHKFKENNFRVLMRRDQVLKLCANHRITPEIKLDLLNEKQVRWMANDCSEGALQTELLAAKFRCDDDAKKFVKEFENSQKLSKNIQFPASSKSVKTINDLSKLNAEHGSWTCQHCLTVNRPNAVKCACCSMENLKNHETNDVKIIYEAMPSSEQIEKARSFGLPDTFYLYEKKPECKGCVGCENEQ